MDPGAQAFMQPLDPIAVASVEVLTTATLESLTMPTASEQSPSGPKVNWVVLGVAAAAVVFLIATA